MIPMQGATRKCEPVRDAQRRCSGCRKADNIIRQPVKRHNPKTRRQARAPPNTKEGSHGILVMAYRWRKQQGREQGSTPGPAGAGAPDEGTARGEVPFIQEAIRHALGVSLPAGEGAATEFVTGSWPIFFFQFGGRLMQIKLAGHPYFDAVSRPFVSGDPDALLQKARAQGIGDAVAGHRAWIAVTYMNPPPPAGEDPSGMWPR